MAEVGDTPPWINGLVLAGKFYEQFNNYILLVAKVVNSYYWRL